VSLTLEQAAAFLHMHPETLRERAKAGIVPASKPGKCWVWAALDRLGEMQPGSALASFVAKRTRKYLVQEILRSLDQASDVEHARSIVRAFEER
jgi:hypothetical protein